MQKTTIITLIVSVLFVYGAGAIIYYGRPVMHLDESPKNIQPLVIDESTDEKTEAPTTTPLPEETAPTSELESAQAPGTYTSVQISTHAIESDCWASVSGNVYDLTSWVSRHPGGSKAIIGLCGTDATAKFDGKHGGSSSAKTALALLKIGILSE